MVQRLTDEACQDIEEPGTHVYHIDRLFRAAFPGAPVTPGLVRDVRKMIKSVMKLVTLRTQLEVIPITAYGWQLLSEEEYPEVEKEAQRCVSGCYPRFGPPVAFAKADDVNLKLLTAAWKGQAAFSAFRHVEVDGQHTKRLRDVNHVNRGYLRGQKQKLQRLLFSSGIFNGQSEAQNGDATAS